MDTVLEWKYVLGTSKTGTVNYISSIKGAKEILILFGYIGTQIQSTYVMSYERFKEISVVELSDSVHNISCKIHYVDDNRINISELTHTDWCVSVSYR